MVTASAYGSMADRPRARDLGIAPGAFQTGPLNAITDVAGVRVGQVTIVEGDAVRTGVTAVLPAQRQPVSGEGPRRGVRRQRIRQARRIDAGERARHDRVTDRAHQHAVGRTRQSRRSSAGRWSSPATRRYVPSTPSSGKQTTGPQRHPRPARDARARRCSDLTRAATVLWKKARSAPARARSRSAGKAVSARRRAACALRATHGRWGCSYRRTMAAALSSTACRSGRVAA